MKRRMKKLFVMVLLLSVVLIGAYAGGEGESEAAAAEPFNIAAFVPGVVAGSPLYEQLVEGAEKAVAEFDNATLKVVEGGFNQAEWEEKMTALAAGGECARKLRAHENQ